MDQQEPCTMLPRHRRPPAGSFHAADQDFDPLILRIRRLAAHRGYDRAALMSPMLKRLMPASRPSGDAVAETTELLKRLTEAGLDGKAVTYLIESLDTELDFARLRLT